MTQSQERKMNTGEAVGQQWSNIHIENYACNVSENYAEQIRIGNSMKMLRNEYDATIATQAAELDRLRQELAQFATPERVEALELAFDLLPNYFDEMSRGGLMMTVLRTMLAEMKGANDAK